MSQFANLSGRFELGSESHWPITGCGISSSLEVALSILGDDEVQTLMFHIENTSGLSRQDFTQNPVAVGRALARILGSGAQVVEKLITNHIRAVGTISGQSAFIEDLTLSTESELSLLGRRVERSS